MSETEVNLPVQSTAHSKRSKATPAPRESAMVSPPEGLAGTETDNALRDALDYLRDFTERSVLFWDALRERADNMIGHERAGKPPLLDFDHELLLDARRFERPANYALLRITRAGDVCFDACFDPSKPPVVIVDPRAGHGPGIGGFKRDSEVGMAMHEGHTVYFVTFFPEPCPGQTLADVLHALRRFVGEVARRHPGKPPVLYGNCQAGWAITLLSADCEGLVGPAVLNGSPLSYWAGESGVNPMRIAGGLVGGAWLTHLLADMDAGRFDGAWLAANFENLKPEAVWDKYANLFTHIDTERERFLEFERWWNGFYFLSREEILAIVENLFIGNRLEEGKVRICEDCVADLRRIRNPLVIFASWGDNITPPQQALGWIPAVYRNTDDLKAAGQRIVYLTNPHAGHLGLFVSASVARLEHRAILESLEEIESLAPGLYEMKIDNPTGNPDCRQPQYAVRFEERQVQDLDFGTPHEAFEHVRQLSELNESAYRTFISPLVRTFANPWSAAMLEWMHPMRTSRYMFSEMFSPWMNGIAQLARLLEKRRTPLPAGNPFLAQERALIQQVSETIVTARGQRDAAEEQAFSLLFGSLATPARAKA
ncbi:TPA: DUF3141 domain-containing protein [Burkholderia contaminans]|uniref:DUF3141 domain-containing protein n=2 Tax=Burkholderia TaxID=32008 RepID=UPI000AA354D2|nr:DUF3141 domain-containing protein [Burkholderia contaminans]HDR9037949.1 DUF3141 domain-containing protein [Burkholderia vietnamiensis]